MNRQCFVCKDVSPPEKETAPAQLEAELSGTDSSNKNVSCGTGVSGVQGPRGVVQGATSSLSPPSFFFLSQRLLSWVCLKRVIAPRFKIYSSSYSKSFVIKV